MLEDKNMDKLCIVDFRMPDIIKEYIRSLGYGIIENRFNPNVYDEISAHPDIYYVSIDGNLFCSMEKALPGFRQVIGVSKVEKKYPLDVPYNIAVIGKKCCHNFKYTDHTIKKYLEDNGYEFINVEQGYTKCSTVVLDDNSCIVSDIAIARELLDSGIDVLYVSEPDIVLKTRVNPLIDDETKMSFKTSDMKGFIGGAMAKLGNEVILFGDISKLSNGVKIKKFVESKGYTLKDFPGLDVVDLGGIVIINKKWY